MVICRNRLLGAAASAATIAIGGGRRHQREFVVTLDAIPTCPMCRSSSNTLYGERAATGGRPGHLPSCHRAVIVPAPQAVRGFSMVRRISRLQSLPRWAPIHWARSRVLEAISQAMSQLPPGVTPTLGPDAPAPAGSSSMHWWIAAANSTILIARLAGIFSLNLNCRVCRVWLKSHRWAVPPNSFRSNSAQQDGGL